MNKKDLISIIDFTKDEILKIMELAFHFESNPTERPLVGKVIASLFFEPSTRTRLSFESAINYLGGSVIGFSDTANTSASKGETFHDTIMTVSNYCDMIVMRHHIDGAPRYASEISKVPIVNAGDGSNQHPSQTLLDLFSILKTQETLEGVKIMMVGDLKYGRTVHSLTQALSLFGAKFIFVAPKELKMPNEYLDFLDSRGMNYIETEDIMEYINDVDIIYMTRVQRERFSDLSEYERVKDSYILRRNMIEGTKDNMRILHPLPRVNEINSDVDSSPKAYYFEQTRNGLITRMAIISYLFNTKVPSKNISANIAYDVVCSNSKCITNSEAIATNFVMLSSDKNVLHCNYCEKITYK